MTTKVPGPTDWLRQQRATASTAAAPATPACNNEDAIDSQIERFLQQHNVKYAPKSMIPIGLFDEKASLSNQARDVPIVPESVERFTASLRRGEYLPPVVVFPQGNRVVTVDGNNRYASHKRHGSQFVPGFVIDENTPSETIALLTVAANNGHGVTPDLKWRVRQAALLVSHGFSVEQAATAAGVTKGQLGDYQASQRADARARVLRVANFAELPQTIRRDIGRLQLDSVFLQAARLVMDTGMGTDDVRHLVKEVKALVSESDQIKYVVELAERRKLEERTRRATGGARLSSSKNSLNTSIGKILHVDPAELARTVLTEGDLALLLKRIFECVDHLGALEAALTAGREEARRAG